MEQRCLDVPWLDQPAAQDLVGKLQLARRTISGWSGDCYDVILHKAFRKPVEICWWSWSVAMRRWMKSAS